MKRTTIIVISLIIGISFFGLLFLQTRIVASMVTMRKQQFDEMVFRALDQTSRDLERNETFRYLETMAEQTDFDADSLNSQESLRRIEETLELGDSAMTPFRVKTQTIHPSQMPKALTLHPTASLDAASQRFQEFVKNAYLYQKGVLDEVIYTVLYNASERDFRDRIDFRLLDSNLRSELQAGGITLNYHFSVIDASGVEVYRCEDYDDK
ncbi:MAG: two-component sensor histidine kinase, partial [Bacteroidaceae bacterium]|nr:two-component sensor histidine kinase [Bacteroidaceae bacterium]